MHVMTLSLCNNNQNQYTEVKFNLLSGVCLYLKTEGSYVNAYNCSQFKDGCHNTSFQSRRIFDCKCSNLRTLYYVPTKLSKIFEK